MKNKRQIKKAVWAVCIALSLMMMTSCMQKGLSLPLVLGFDTLKLHHLAGVHKLRDLLISRSDRKSVMETYTL